MQNKPALVLKDLRYSYDGATNQLNIDELELPDSGIALFYGDNGSGKTTLLKYLAGLIRADDEDSRTDDNLNRFREEALYLHQTPYLLTGSIRRNLSLAAPGRPIEELERALRQVGMNHAGERNTAALSDGERKRVALARALLSRRRILLFDEPAAHLDYDTRRLLEKLLPRLAAEGRLLLITTHLKEFGYRLGTEVYTIEQGKLKTARENIYSGQVHTRSDGTVSFRTRETDLIIPDVAGDFRTAVLAYDEVIIALEPLHSSARNILSGTVTGITHRPDGALVHLECGIPVTARVTEWSLRELGLQPGSRAAVMFKASSLRLY